MKLSGPVLLILMLLAGALRPVSEAPAMKDDYDTLWAKVDSLEEAGLPRSARDVVEQILTLARQERNEPQQLKAHLYRSKFIAALEEDEINQIVEGLAGEIANLTRPSAAVLHSILAELFWRYYQSNRYIVLERTAVSGVDENDIGTWDQRRLVDRVVREYALSLADRDALTSTSVTEYAVLLKPEGHDRRLRPTLFDFLAHRALEVFQDAESGLAEPLEPFPFDDPRMMGTAEGFSGLEIETPESLSTDYLAIRLYQDLIRFHLADSDPAALVTVDLARLDFVRRSSRVADRDSAYVSRLRDLDSRYAGHPIGTAVSHALATVLIEEGRRYDPFKSDQFKWHLKRAHELCSQAIQRFPRSYGAEQCEALRVSIEQKSAQFSVEEVIEPDRPFRLRLEYRNVDRVFAAVVPVGMREMMKSRFLSGSEREEFENEVVRRERVFSGEFALPDDGDYQSHATELPMPALKTGLYVVIVGSDPGFGFDGEARGLSYVSASRLGIIERRASDNSLQVRVVDRVAGSPVPLARIRLWEVEYVDRQRRPREVGSFLSGDDGTATLLRLDGGSFFITVEHGEERLVSTSWRYAWGPERPESPHNVTHFFTDRAIYRPGQTVFFKGILLRKEGDRHEIRRGARTTVWLVDPNQREVASLDLKANEFGSVSGSFAAPTGSGTGRMSIRDSDGSVGFRVEEYKRPRFEVVVDSFEGEAELGDRVSLAGLARAFSGAPVDGAELRYRVTRTPVFRPWQVRWGIVPPQAEAEIASGRAVTDDQGRFEIGFGARPDLDIPPSAHPVFLFRVVVDVTDASGETRTGVASVRIGYTTLVLDIRSPRYWDREVVSSVGITAENVEGNSVPATGELVISRLRGPDRLLRSRPWGRVDRPVITQDDFAEDYPLDVYDDEDDPKTWPVAEVVLRKEFDTATSEDVTLAEAATWPPGVYRIDASTTDGSGREVRAERLVTVYSGSGDELPAPVLDLMVPVKVSGEPGETARLLVGSAARDVRVFVEVERKGRITEKRVVRVSASQTLMEFAIEEADRGNFAVHVSFARHGRAVVRSQVISVPYTNKQLTLKLETFRDELYPGQHEEWRVRVAGDQGEPVAAELLAAMYDASLDQFVGHDWYLNLYPIRAARLGWLAANEWGALSTSVSGPRWNRRVSARRRSFDRLNWFGLDDYIGYGRIMFARSIEEAEVAMAVPDEAGGRLAGDAPEQTTQPPESGAAPGSSAGFVRSDFNETAFFLPELRTDEDGAVSFSFRIPEALTRWRMLGLAHTTDLRVGTLEAFTTTTKDVMITANAPRFLREGDEVRFAANLQSLAEDTLTGTARLALFDLETMRPLDAAFGNTTPETSFTVAPGRSEGLRWTIRVPAGVDAIVYRVTAESGSQSDGEQKPLPVLTNRMLVTESLPLPMRGPGTRTFSFEKLKENRSSTLRHHALTLEYSPNPVWYAVQALPYMMEFPHECSEQVFSRLYANSIAAHIVRQNPRIQVVFERWRDLESGALQSNLEKNQELKSLVIEETPWLMAARDESERKRRIAVLFDFARMSDERATAIEKLVGAQHPTGAWPWFAGLPPSRFITQHIVAGFGHLDRLGVLDPNNDDVLGDALRRAIAYLDREIRADYDALLERGADLDARHLGWLQIHYLYARSFFTDLPVPQESRVAFDYYVGQARRYWLKNALYAQGMIALALYRRGDTDIPQNVIRSLAENASHSDEQGMYWKFNRGYYWYQAPVETQALLIEAFDEIAADRESVADMQLWLLKQKQTQDWKTTKATTEAVYALLMRGTNLIDEDSYVTIRVGDQSIDSRTAAGAEPGTGYFTAAWEGKDIGLAMADVEVSKVGPGPAWGALYWQYFEQLDRITPAETPLSIEKTLFREEMTGSGPVLRPLDRADSLSPGDRVKVRIVIRVDRDMEFVHLKDMRAAGLEPINVLSGHRYQGGLYYYESTRDAATHFFIGYLPKGTYVFEYPLRVNLAGDYSNGITTIQSMYAPEFASHSEGIRVRIEDRQ